MTYFGLATWLLAWFVCAVCSVHVLESVSMFLPTSWAAHSCVCFVFSWMLQIFHFRHYRATPLSRLALVTHRLPLSIFYAPRLRLYSCTWCDRCGGTQGRWVLWALTFYNPHLGLPLRERRHLETRFVNKKQTGRHGGRRSCTELQTHFL